MVNFRSKLVSWPSWLRHRANNAGISGSIPLETIFIFFPLLLKIALYYHKLLHQKLNKANCCGKTQFGEENTSCFCFLHIHKAYCKRFTPVLK